MSENAEIIKRWYQSPAREFLCSDSEWLLAEGFPYGERYVGVRSPKLTFPAI